MVYFAYLFEKVRRMKVIFSSSLELGDGMKAKKLDKLKKKIEEKPLFAREYLVYLSENKTGELEIMKANQLVFSYYDSHPISVVGLFKEYDQAIDWITQITTECFKERGDCKLKEYIKCRYF